MNRIDIIGVPGVGKSTIIEELRKRRKNNNWQTTNEAVKDILDKHFKKDKYSVQDLVLLFSSVFHPLKKYVAVDKNKLNQFFKKKLSSKDFILDTCIESFSNDRDTEPYMKAKRISFLVDTLEDLTLLDHYKPDKTILCDESLSAKIFSFVINFNGSNDEKLMEILRHFYLPDAYILMEADINEIVSRLNNREREMTTDHSGLSKEEILFKLQNKIKKNRKGVDLLSKIGIKGIIVDTTKSKLDSVIQIEEFLK